MASNYKRLGNYIQQVDVRNTDLSVELLLGVSIEKKFIESHANTVGTDFSNYKIVKRGQFAYGPVTSRNGDKISIALLDEADACLISSSYTPFEIVKPDELNAEYLMMLFRNPEYDRFARYNSWGSAREVFSWEDFCDSRLYIPEIDEQKRIVFQYKTISNRVELLKRMNEKIYDCCMVGYNNLTLGLSTSDELPEGFKKATIGEYADVKSGFAFKSNWWKKEGVPVIKIANISQNTLDMETADCVSLEHAARAKDYFAKPGDLLIAMTGATTGKLGIVPYTSDKLLVNQRVGKFALGDSPLEKLAFLFCSLQCEEVSSQIHPDGDAGSAQDNLSPDDIKNIAIVWPPNELISRFNSIYENMLRQTMINNAEIFVLSDLLKHLISRI